MKTPLNLEPLARKTYENSTLYRRPWETLTAEERANWLRMIAHLATPPGERRGRVTAILAKGEKEQAA